MDLQGEEEEKVEVGDENDDQEELGEEGGSDIEEVMEHEQRMCLD